LLQLRHASSFISNNIIADLGRVKGTGQQYRAGHTLLQNWKKAKKLLSSIEHAAEDVALFEEVVKPSKRSTRPVKRSGIPNR
jgi:hypothetical protein